MEETNKLLESMNGVFYDLLDQNSKPKSIELRHVVTEG